MGWVPSSRAHRNPVAKQLAYWPRSDNTNPSHAGDNEELTKIRFV